MSKYYLNYLDELESEAIYILREVWAQFENPVILFSGGKDSILVTHLAKKAFYPAKIPLIKLIVLLVAVDVMKKRLEQKNVFFHTEMNLDNGILKINVQNCGIY